MRRSLLLIVLLSLPTSAFAQATVDEVVLEKKKSEWIKMFLSDASTPKQRTLALLALETLGAKCEGVLPVLLEVLKRHKDEKGKETNADTRREVALALGRMGEDAKSTIRALALALRKDPSDKVREGAAKALGGAMVPHSRLVVSDLADALKDPHAGTRAAAAETLRELGKDAVSVTASLIECLKPGKDKQADAFMRIYLAQLLGRLDKEGAAAEATLLAILTDKEENAKVREAAAEAIGRLGARLDDPAPALDQAIKDDNADTAVRLAALVALGKISAEAKVVWSAVKDLFVDKKTDSILRAQAVRLAGPLGKDEPAVIAQLQIVCLKDDNIEVRLAAIQELGVLGPLAKDAEKTLQTLYDTDNRASIREAAAAALKKVRVKPAG